MRLFNINGKLVKKNVSKCLIDWDKKSRSNIQFTTKQFLKNYWLSHIVYEEFPVFGSLMKVDFLNATKKIAIEVQGNQHQEFNKFFHDNSRLKYLNSIKRDYNKAVWLEKNGFTLIEIYEKDFKEGLSLEFFKNTFNINIV